MLKASGKLAFITDKYVTNPDNYDPSPMKFETFEGAETIKIAVTGDWLPLDFMTADGVPAGFNVAVLSELSKIARVNIELVNIDTAARVAAIMSRRVDGVFWFRTMNEMQNKLRAFDVPE